MPLVGIGAAEEEDEVVEDEVEEEDEGVKVGELGEGAGGAGFASLPCFGASTPPRVPPTMARMTTMATTSAIRAFLGLKPQYRFCGCGATVEVPGIGSRRWSTPVWWAHGSLSASNRRRRGGRTEHT